MRGIVLLKKILLLSVFLLTTAVIPGAEPENFIPEASQQVMRLNVNRVVQLPWIMNMLQKADEKCREFSLLLDELKKNNIQATTFFAGDLWLAKTGNDDKSFVMLIKTALPEAKFAEFFNAQKVHNKNVELNVSTLNGKRIYLVKYAPAYKATDQTPVMATYLTSDVIALLPFTADSSIHLSGLQPGNGNRLVKNIDRKKLCAAVGHAIKKKDKIRSLNAQIDLSGTEQRDLTLNAVISFKNAKTAMRKAMEMQFIAPSFAGLLFGNDQKLMEEITGALQVVPYQEKVMLNFTLTKALQDKLATYFANPENVPALNINPADLSNMQ
ncbi:MAG: hypothetical protein E7039_04940 [Lentisphaerae bacterium]|nr:hypothetical protein [Lentisphaerota bacterium]